MEIEKDWCLKMADAEGDQEISAGFDILDQCAAAKIGAYAKMLDRYIVACADLHEACGRIRMALDKFDAANAKLTKITQHLPSTSQKPRD